MKHVLAKTKIIEMINTPSIFNLAENGEFSSNACRKLKTGTIKNPQHGIRVQLRGAEIDKQATSGGN